MSCSKQCFDKEDKFYGHEDCATCPGRDDGRREMANPPIVPAEKAIVFECHHCMAKNYGSYSLEEDVVNYAKCYSDIIACSVCGKDNKVVDKT